jgi:hypothetical protein
LSRFLKAHVFCGALIALLVVPAALAKSTEIFGPDLRVEGQSKTSSVAFSVILLPSYNVSKPGVTVTMTNCKTGQKAPIRVVRRSGGLGGGRSLQAHPGKIVWKLNSVPAKPAKPKLQLWLAVPKGVKNFCLHTSMYDNFTKTTVNVNNRVPI